MACGQQENKESSKSSSSLNSQESSSSEVVSSTTSSSSIESSSSSSIESISSSLEEISSSISSEIESVSENTSENTSNESSIEESVSSSEEETVSSQEESINTSSEEEISSSSEENITSSSEEPISSASSNDDGRELRENELYTDDGLVVKFNAKGARIDKIMWGNKQIAKDGFTVGRCANRIAGAQFTLNGINYNLTKNDGNNSLHGGGNSWQGPFANATWTKVSQTPSSIVYSIHSPKGDNGYPGNLDMTVAYTLSQDGELSIEYNAISDEDTLCNPTNHLFIAINGTTSYSNIDLWIDADNYTPLQNGIPTGEIVSVVGTQFDYREEKAFDGSKKYDDNYALNGEGYRKVATMTGKSLGVKVDVYTDRPGLQLYKDGSGNICLETQLYPDAVHHDNFPSAVLEANTDFYSKTSYCFSPVN